LLYESSKKHYEIAKKEEYRLQKVILGYSSGAKNKKQENRFLPTFKTKTDKKTGKESEPSYTNEYYLE